MTILGLDADTDLTHYAPAIKAKGLQFVCRYLKNLGKQEAQAISKAGLRIVMIFEVRATNSLAGERAGAQDGMTALRQAQALGAPSTAAIYTTVDTDVTAADVSAIEDYFAAFDDVIFGHYRIGGYADGTALSELRNHGLPYCWLAGAMGWDGSRQFFDTGHPTLVQGPTISKGKGGNWAPHGIKTAMPVITWPDLGFNYDPDVAMSDDYGGFLLA